MPRAILGCLALLAVLAAHDAQPQPRPCARSCKTLKRSCVKAAKARFKVLKGTCSSRTSRQERIGCKREHKAAFKFNKRECRRLLREECKPCCARGGEVCTLGPALCGNGVINDGEGCDPGVGEKQCAADQVCNSRCTCEGLPVGPPTADPAPAGPTTTTVPGRTPTTSTTTTTTLRPFCGDGVVNQAHEICDGAAGGCAGICTAECTCRSPSDACAEAEQISMLPFAGTQDASAATTAPSDPVLSCGSATMPQQSSSVWYTFTSPGEGVAIADTRGSDYDTVLAAFTGTCDDLTEIACNDDFVDLDSRVTFPVARDQMYLLEVVAFQGNPAGRLVLGVTRCGDGVVDPGERCDGAMDTACPGLCRPDCSCAPSTGDALMPCDATDTWSFAVRSGQEVVFEADTVNAATAADLCVNGTCDGGGTFLGDDELPCRFPPPEFRCPQAVFFASSDMTCRAEVTTCSERCADPSVADYGVRLRLDGVLAPVALIIDDDEAALP